MRKMIVRVVVSAGLAAIFSASVSAAIVVRDSNPRFINAAAAVRPPSTVTVPPTAVPEPGTLSLLCLGALGVGALKRRR